MWAGSNSAPGPPRPAPPDPWSRSWPRSWVPACGGRRRPRPGRQEASSASGWPEVPRLTLEVERPTLDRRTVETTVGRCGSGDGSGATWSRAQVAAASAGGAVLGARRLAAGPPLPPPSPSWTQKSSALQHRARSGGLAPGYSRGGSDVGVRAEIAVVPLNSSEPPKPESV